MVYHMLTNRDEWGDDGRGLLYVGNTAIVSIFAILNFYWFYKLLLVAVGSPSSSDDKLEKVETVKKEE